MPLITEALVAKTLPLCKLPGLWADALDPALQRYDIRTPERIAAFLAQTGHESGQFNVLQENLRYTSAERLVKVWPRRFPSIDSAQPYVNYPKALANVVYAKRLGNGDIASGDGWRFRGRGIIQLTGRSNYVQAGAALGLDLEARPDVLLEPGPAAMAAAWFWASRGLNALADDRTSDNDLEDFTEITRRINGGAVGLKERLALYQRVEQALA